MAGGGGTFCVSADGGVINEPKRTSKKWKRVVESCLNMLVTYENDDVTKNLITKPLTCANSHHTERWRKRSSRIKTRDRMSTEDSNKERFPLDSELWTYTHLMRLHAFTAC
jgi:hypothetical protein